jgi:arylsulfatase A-like enzyme
MRWPGQIPAGSTCRQPVMTIDVLPTVAGLIDAPLPPLPIDGKDIGPLLRGEASARSPHDALFFYYHDNHLEGVRAGRWKLHYPHGYRSMIGRLPGRGGIPGKYDYSVETGLELYDLDADVGEAKDVAADHPEVMERLVALGEAMRASLGDALQQVEGTDHRAPGRLPPKEASNGR